MENKDVPKSVSERGEAPTLNMRKRSLIPVVGQTDPTQIGVYIVLIVSVLALFVLVVIL